MISRIISGFVAIVFAAGALAPVAAQAAPKVSYQKKFSNSTISAAKKYGGGLSTKACVNSAAGSLAKLYAQKGKTTTAQRRSAIRKVESCGGVEVGVQVSKQKTAKKVVSKSSAANKKRLKKQSHTWVGARTYKKKKTYFTVLIVAAPTPSLNTAMSNDVLSRVHGFNRGGSTTSSCLQNQANQWGKQLSTKGSSTAPQRNSVMASAAAACDLRSVRLYHSKHTTAAKAANQVKSASNATWNDSAYNVVGARVWNKGKERFTVVMVGMADGVTTPTPTPTPTTPAPQEYPDGPYLPEDWSDDEFLPFTPWHYATKPYILESTPYCDRWSHNRAVDPGRTMLTAYWACHSVPDASVMAKELVDAANRIRARETLKDGVVRVPFPHVDSCWDGFQQDFADYKTATYGKNLKAYETNPHSAGGSFVTKGRNYFDALINCRTNPLARVRTSEVITYGRIDPGLWWNRGFTPATLAENWIGGYLSSPAHRAYILQPLPEGMSFHVGVGWSCTDPGPSWMPGMYDFASTYDDYPVCNLVFDPAVVGH